MCKFLKAFSDLSISNKERKISSRKNEICGKLHLDIIHFAKLSISLVVTNITFSFLYLSGISHLCVYWFIVQNSESRRVFVAVSVIVFLIL